LPVDYQEEFICDTLGITLTELYKQPYDWVDKMMQLKTQKDQAEQWEAKKQQSNQNIKT